MRIEKKEQINYVSVVLENDVRVPNTNIILEKGEAIKVPYSGTQKEFQEKYLKSRKKED